MILECGCPGEYPSWNDEDVDLGGTCVHTLPIPTLFHMPVAYEAYLQRQQDEITRLELPEIWPGFALTRTGWLRGQIIRPLNNVHSPSRFVGFLPNPFTVRAKLHSGDVGTMRNSIQNMQSELIRGGKMPKELYLCYLTCPRCQDSRGGARILLLRRWQISRRLQARAS
jgi:hypothetical protein